MHKPLTFKSTYL